MHHLFKLALVALVGGVLAWSSVKDLNQKQGSLLYKATYLNDDSKRTRAVLAGVYNSFDGTTPDLNGNIRITTFFNVEVQNNKGTTMGWTNLYTAWPTIFPPTVVPAAFGLGAKSIVAEQYQLTALDKTSDAMLGSLVFAGSYATVTGGITGAGTNVYPVLGATGVYKHAKTVKIIYGDNGSRTVLIYKNAF